MGCVCLLMQTFLLSFGGCWRLLASAGGDPQRPGHPGGAPEDEHRRHVIDTLALYVLDDGCAFEQAIMERGRGNPLFSFLFDLGSPDHTYYIWRLFSFAQVQCCTHTVCLWDAFLLPAGRCMPPCYVLTSSFRGVCTDPHLTAVLLPCRPNGSKPLWSKLSGL